MRKASMIVVLAGGLLATRAFATTTASNVPNTFRDTTGSLAARDLLVRVDEALNGLTYTYYLFGGDFFDAAAGVYKVDCSGYVNRMVEDAVPSAYDAVTSAGDTARPSAEDYYGFFVSIPYNETRNGWRRVRRVLDLRPGDILVYRYDDAVSTSSTGHAMIVVDLPVRYATFTNAYRIRVSDSARSGHSSDNRGSGGSGVGAGYVLVQADPDTGKPQRFAWSLSGYWKSGLKLAMGRPIAAD
jgi:hypothetical protein